MKTAIIYHQVKPGVDCADGITGAWVAKRKYPDADLIGACYGGEIPKFAEINDRGELIKLAEYDRVIIVDFSFPRNILELWEGCFDLLVIDHHKTAMADLEGFSNAVFDMSESGATLAWKTLFPDEEMPAFLAYVRDRDLWNFHLLDSEEIHEAMSFIGRKLYQLDFLAMLSADELQALLSPIGAKLLEPKRKRVARIAATALRRTIKGHSVMAVELAEREARLISDVCSAVYKAHPEADFVAAYFWDSSVWQVSFRSDKNGSNFDVSEVAKQFGGGGHRNASGAKVESLSNLFEA